MGLSVERMVFEIPPDEDGLSLRAFYCVDPRGALIETLHNGRIIGQVTDEAYRVWNYAHHARQILDAWRTVLESL